MFLHSSVIGGEEKSACYFGQRRREREKRVEMGGGEVRINKATSEKNIRFEQMEGV